MLAASFHIVPIVMALPNPSTSNRLLARAERMDTGKHGPPEIPRRFPIAVVNGFVSSFGEYNPH